ncbi:hypothetical protein SH611_10875 [Geminicoccaceae bacterium 1502E]|nr:hypothetical protein [Geminicoccaceae bacterium 1502E]
MRVALDLPLEGTPSSRFLAGLLACLTGLCVLALAIAAGAQARLGELARYPAMVSVALPPLEPGMPPSGEQETILGLLRHMPGIAFAAPVPESEVARLVEPWLGRQEGAPLPLPRLIDVTLVGGVEIAPAAIERALQEAVPGISVGATGTGGRGLASARMLRDVAAAAGLVLLAGYAAATAWLTRLSLDLHARTIELLRMMGAGERYVTSQYETHALKAALQGGLAGLSGAFLPLLAFQYMPGLAGGTAAPLGEGAWLLLASVPLAGTMLATLSARLAARRGLRQLG